LHLNNGFYLINGYVSDSKLLYYLDLGDKVQPTEMKYTVKHIVTSQTKCLHLAFILLAVVLATTFLYMFLIPFVFWNIYGSGASADRIGRLPIMIFVGEWLALIIALLFLGFGFYRNTAKHNLSNAKSYLLASIALILLYLLRVPILTFMFTVFQ